MIDLPPVLARLALLTALACALYMTGVIWTVQVVHYALFGHVGQAHWRRYHPAHTRRITLVVLLPMVLELGSSGLLAFCSAFRALHSLLVAGFLLTLTTWAITFLISVPLHGRLGERWNEGAFRSLVGTNWLRTAAWTGHAAVMLLVVGKALG